MSKDDNIASCSTDEGDDYGLESNLVINNNQSQNDINAKVEEIFYSAENNSDCIYSGDETKKINADTTAEKAKTEENADTTAEKAKTEENADTTAEKAKTEEKSDRVAEKAKAEENADTNNENLNILAQESIVENSENNEMQNADMIEKVVDMSNVVEAESSPQEMEKLEKAVYLNEDWSEKVKNFMQEYPLAQTFASSIGQEIMSDKRLSGDSQCLEKAFNRVISKAYAPPCEIINDQEFRNQYVFNNEEIKTKIIDDYLKELGAKRPPKTICSSGQITLTPPDRPRSIDQAGEIMKKMLQNRRI